MFKSYHKIDKKFLSTIVAQKFDSLNAELTQLEEQVDYLKKHTIVTTRGDNQDFLLDDAIKFFSERLQTTYDTLTDSFHPDELGLAGVYGELNSRLNKINREMHELIYYGVTDNTENPEVSLSKLSSNWSSKELNTISLEKFLEEIETLPHETIRSAYAFILYRFTVDKRNNSFVMREFEVVLTDALHNLPVHLGVDLKDFSHHWFWSSIFNNRFLKAYVLDAFVSPVINQYFKSEQNKEG